MALLKDFLCQEYYKDCQGHDVPASSVQCIGTYKHIFDGFHDWICGACTDKHHDRTGGWLIEGQVLECKTCKKHNLILRNDVEWVGAKMTKGSRVEELEARIKELESLDNAKLLQQVKTLETKLSMIEKLLG